jgi:hypothetical protein
MNNNYNSKMASMGLTNIHGWAEKTETKISGSMNDPMVHLIVSSDNCTRDLVNDSKIDSPTN